MKEKLNLDQLLHLHVRKRDGSLVKFNKEKIATAIWNAVKNIDGDIDINTRDKLSLTVSEIINEVKRQKYNPVNIEYIQDKIIQKLKDNNFADIAKHYEDYRLERDKVREMDTNLFKDIKGIIEQTSEDILNENANKDGRVIPTQRDLLAGVIAKHYAKQHLLSKEIVQAHEDGLIHYHDMDYAPFFPMTNCCLVDLKFMFENGFKMGNAEIEQPKSIKTAADVTAQIIAQVSSHQYGGTSIERIDEILAPYADKSYKKHMNTAIDFNICNADEYAHKMTVKEIRDAAQSLEYECNTLHTANGQTPFITFGFGLGDGKWEKEIQKAILQIRINGLGKTKKTAIFPKLVFSLKDGLNLKPEDPNYDVKQKALECASKRMYPDILSYDKVVEVTGSFKSPMGCRSFLHPWENENGQEIHAGRNNLGVISLNLPRIALDAGGDIKKFWRILDNERLDICFKALMSRIERLEGVTADVAPILYMEGAFGVKMEAKDKIIELFKNGRSSISLGYIGIHETVTALGMDPYSAKGQELAELIVKTLANACVDWTESTGYAFSLYGTPSENLCDRFLRLDKEVYGEVKGVTDKDYYTNSFHVDVRKEVNVYDKIDLESIFPKMSRGGFICYGEFPNMKHNLEALENVWDYAYNNVPYYGTNTPIDECYECGFSGEFECTSKGFTCSRCGNHDEATISVTRRVCGYLGNPGSRPFNNGKQDEVQKRVKHM